MNAIKAAGETANLLKRGSYSADYKFPAIINASRGQATGKALWAPYHKVDEPEPRFVRGFFFARRGPLSHGEIKMTLASLRDRLAVPLEWIARQIAARPWITLKAVLVVWLVSLIVVAWAF